MFMSLTQRAYTHTYSHSQSAPKQTHRRSQDFVCGVHFFWPNDRFLVVALKDRLNIPPNLSYQAKTVLKIDSCSGWGCTSCPGGALSHFPCKLGLKFFFHRPGGCRCTHCTPLATPMNGRYLIEARNFQYLGAPKLLRRKKCSCLK